MPFFAGNAAIAGSGGYGQISRIITAASQASVDFTSIPATYQDLEIHYTCRSNVVATIENMFLKINGDATAVNYATTDLLDDAAAGTVASTTSGGYTNGVPGTSTTAGFSAQGRLKINGYLGTTFFKVFVQTGSYATTTANTHRLLSSVGTWQSTAAITRLTLTVPTSFVNGSVFVLYGVGTA